MLVLYSIWYSRIFKQMRFFRDICIFVRERSGFTVFICFKIQCCDERLLLMSEV